MEFSHTDKSGKAAMVDISAKKAVKRTALAEGRICMDKETVRLIKDNSMKKGDVLAVARIAGIVAGKKTSDFIPLCHNISIDRIAVDFEVKEEEIYITSEAVCTDKTGIEMEALMAVSTAALTIYDMCKAVDKKMHIEGIRLLKKTKEEL